MQIFLYYGIIFNISDMQESRFDKYNAFKTKGGNIIWGAAMQLAWNELRENFAKDKTLTFHTQNHQAIKTIQNFNKGTFKQSDLDKDSVYVKSGYGQATLDTINAQTQKKFPNKSFNPLTGPLGDQDIISYAYLYKQIIFELKFERSQGEGFRFNEKPVQSFYAQNKDQREQVNVHYYKNEHSFMVELKGKNKKDSLFLIKDPKVKNVDEAIKLTTEYANKKTLPLKKGDQFEMPVVKLDVTRTFEEMQGLRFKNQELKDYVISIMYQAVKLNIDESGAKVENEAVMMLGLTSAPPQNDQKFIYLNKSFWVIMKEQGKNPYLCAFIEEPQE